MNVEDMIFISVDDHVVEPPHLFEGRLPARYQDQAPKVVRTEAGDDVWVFNGTQIPNIGLNAVAGKPLAPELGDEPVSAMLAIPFGDTVVYKRGAWTGEHGALRPNEALHWAAITGRAEVIPLLARARPNAEFNSSTAP